MDVFFVISGFFIRGLLLREHEATSRISLSHFYIRRIRRLLPMSLLVLTATVAASILLLTTSRAVQMTIDAGWSATFLANWHFASVGTDYFQEGQPPSALQHFWTLAVEEKFYLVWPLLLIAIGWVTLRRSQHQHALRIAVGVIAVCVVAMSLEFALWQSIGDPTVAYFSTLTRAWELAAGALLSVASPILSWVPLGIRSALCYLGVAGIIAAALLIGPDTLFPGPGALGPVLATSLVIVAGIGATPSIWLLTNPVSRYLGRISYSLYLRHWHWHWHWPVIVLLAAVIPTGNLTYFLIASTASLLLSAASFRFVEDPIRRSRWVASWEGGTVFRERMLFPAVAVGLVGVVIAATLGITAYAGRQNDGTLSVSPVEIKACSGASVLLDVDGCEPIDELSDLQPSIDSFTNDTRGAYSCWRAKDEALEICSYGSSDPDAVRLALVGDSHAAMLLPGLVSQLDERDWHLDTFVGYGCQWTANGKGNCVDVREDIQDRLLADDAYDAVLATSIRSAGAGDENTDAATSYAEAWSPVVA